jgi:hypothetical protein
MYSAGQFKHGQSIRISDSGEQSVRHTRNAKFGGIGKQGIQMSMIQFQKEMKPGWSRDRQ